MGLCSWKSYHLSENLHVLSLALASHCQRWILKPCRCRLSSWCFASSRVATFSLFVRRIDTKGNESRRYGRFYRALHAERRGSFLPWNTSHWVCPSCTRETGIRTTLCNRYSLRRVVSLMCLALPSITVFLSEITRLDSAFHPVYLIFNSSKKIL